jgi:hypothetical protein
VGSIEKRISDLEAAHARTTASADHSRKERLIDDFIGRTLDAMVSIKRAPADQEHVRYTCARLRGLGPLPIATHVAALAALGHEDEDEAREILARKAEERGVSLDTMEKLIDGFAAFVEMARQRREDGA